MKIKPHGFKFDCAVGPLKLPDVNFTVVPVSKGQDEKKPIQIAPQKQGPKSGRLF